MKITVAYAKLDKQVEIPLEVDANCTVALAIQRSGILQYFPEICYPNVTVGIHSRVVSLDAPLNPGDRVEIYRSLKIDPKEARHSRVKKMK